MDATKQKLIDKILDLYGDDHQSLIDLTKMDVYDLIIEEVTKKLNDLTIDQLVDLI